MPYADETLAIARDWRGLLPEVAAEVFALLSSRIAVVNTDPELAAVTLASCSSNIESMLSMMLAGMPASSAKAPATALEHARLMAKRGAGVDDTLRFYRLGVAYFLRRWSDDLRQRTSEMDRFVAALQEASAFVVEYLDIVSGIVSAEHLAERERRQRHAAVLRTDAITALLAGDDVREADRILAHRLDGPQLCFICWSTSNSAQVEVAAVDIAADLGCSRPLLWPQGPSTVVVWLSLGPQTEAVDWSGIPARGVSVASGLVGPGVAGFRLSHDQAQRAKRVAELTSSGPGHHSYDEFELVDLLTSDLAAARGFVLRNLGALARRDDATADLRQTTLAVMGPRGGVSHAARALGVHRNTVIQRLNRAEVLRGRALDDHTAELVAALQLASVIPETVLG